MASPDDRLEEWIIRDDLKKERRSRIVLPSSERLVAEKPGEGEAALESVAAWLDLEKKLPIIELATLSRRALTLTFAEEAFLSPPWVSQSGDADAPHDQWGITLQHAMDLPRGDGHGWQVVGLTGIGTLADGSRGFLNTSRWEVLGIAGTPDWSRHLMITQVMNQAAEPWSKGQDIWLIGYGETAEKLISFLAPYHPPHRFHTADSLEQVSAVDLKGVSATIYVMGASAKTEQQFRALRAPGVGIVTDDIVSDQCMFLSERSGGVAALGPFSTNLEIFPNLSPELIDAMERAWEANERLVAEQAAAADFSAFLPDSPEPSLSVGKSDEEINADFEALVTNLDDMPMQIPEGDIETTANDAVKPLDGQGTDVGNEPEEDEAPLGKVTISVESDAVAGGDQAVLKIEPLSPTVASNEPVPHASNGGENPIADKSSDAINTSDTSNAGVRIKMIGALRVDTPAGELKGRHAEALALLALSENPVAAQQISEALWPNDDHEGHTARTRRTRLLTKIREFVGDAVASGPEGWSIDRQQVTTDYDHLIHVLSNESLSHQEEISGVCAQISSPLAGTGPWADPYRKRMCEELKTILADLKDRAIDADTFDVAKAAKAASSKLGES